ncbi:hypothetical protein C1645_870962 [Glomus cerebriforme]|uniref:PNPLA domain-containing protein n=1 Tax=Glomus cerebriforme TaxID=658196 RepID=A0A397TL15_9GLOM|nr:hypothetical protein C1645_870962 [Glomus cerebriforme]
MEQIISQVENFFLEIENLINLQLQDKTLNQHEIEQKFKEGKELIDNLEEDDEEQHGIFRYKYHTTYANYLKIDGKLDKVSKQERLAKKFEKLFKKQRKDIYETNSRLFTDATLGNINQAYIPKEENKENIQEAVEEELKKIQSILEDSVIKSIRQTFKQFNDLPKTFEDYKKIVICETFLRKIVDNPINESIIGLEEDDTSNPDKKSEDQISKIKENRENRQQLVSSLSHLKSLASSTAYSKRLAFMFHVLKSSNKKEILFNNILFTEEEINKRFKDIALYFHSDKTNRPNTSTWLQEKHKNLGAEIFNFALEFKESLLNDLDEVLQNEDYMTFHKKKANKLWKIAIDFRNAAKGQWNKLKLLENDGLVEYSSEQLERLSIDNGMLAYQEYRAACKIADKAKQLKNQVELRGNMALCLYISNKFIEAQLYALSAIQLQLKNSQKVTRKDFIEAKKIFDKVKGGDPTINATKTIQDSINNDMAKISMGLMFKADRSLVRYQAPREEILHAKNRALKHKVAGLGVMGGAMTVGTSVTIASCVNIYEAVAIIGAASIGGPITLIIGGLFTLGLGIWAGVNLWKTGTFLLEEPEIREKLNKIMIKALEAYDKGEYQKFLEALSEEFKKDASLLKLAKREDYIDTKHIINTLLKYGFRSDGIAYLLNLIGEVLISGKIKINGKTTKDLKMLAINVFDGVMSKKLVTEAKKLDDRIRALRTKPHIVNIFTKIKDFVSLNEYSDIAKDHKDDSQEMPFQSRLEEMRNITRINRAIFDILDAGKDEIKRAIETIKEVQESINSNYQFVNAAKWRHEVLEDLLWVISGESSPKESSEELPKFITYIDIECIGHLNEQLEQASSDEEKIPIYIAIACVYEHLAEKENKIDPLRHWKAAQEYYEKARESDPENLHAALGYAKCLLKLSKYTQIIQLSDTCPNLTSLSEYWRFRSIAYCRQAKYKEAKENIIEALKLDNKNKLADEQKSLLKKLSEENTTEWRINRYKEGKEAIKYERDYLKNSHSNVSPTYNILSIDGGGVCGVLPALWLSEIEYRTHRPISHLFNMIAGTSTGGIIAAGLSVPSWQKYYDPENEPFYDYSDLKPQFSASGLLNLYQSEIKNIFTNNPWKIFKQKYTDEGRHRLFFRHFDKLRLNQALTELVIPAVDEKKSAHLFTRYDDSNDYLNNDTFFDTLMATTAAPTYFPSYKIEGKGIFIDGTLYHSNPVNAAYKRAIQYKVAKEKISILSLGTGSYVLDPLNPDLDQGQKLIVQEGDIDRLMCSLLGSRYQRWQVSLEKPIQFDDYESIPNLLELGHQYIEELDASDENPINKLVESFQSFST